MPSARIVQQGKSKVNYILRGSRDDHMREGNKGPTKCMYVMCFLYVIVE